jgi:Ca2+-binding RTX toxin-like protein
MPSFVQTTPDGSSRVLGAGDIGTVTATGAILDGSVTMANAQFYNFGLVASDDAAVTLSAGRAYVENHGTLSCAGVATVDGLTGVTFQVALNLVNFGSITARALDTAAILAISGRNRIANHGTVTASNGIAIDLRDELPDVQGAGNQIVNTGVIDGLRDGAISIVNGGVSDRVVNSGIVVGDVTLGENDAITNSGHLNGNLSLGLSGPGMLRNSGEIAGDVETSGIVLNAGIIAGSLTLGTGNDVARLVGGVVSGGVLDQGGDDLYIVDGAVDIEDLAGADTVNAWIDFELGAGLEALVLRGGAVQGAGNALGNHISGNGQANLIDGQDGDDTVLGLSGMDTIYTGSGNDSLDGGNGHDYLDGGGENDRLVGSHGDDTLVGAGGNDRLDGGGSNDVLIGGTGTDTMSGGIEPDMFVFEQVDDSTVTAPDVITGFTTRVDVIDLSRIDANGNDAAESAFVRVGAFTGVAGQLVLRVVGASVFLEGDVDADGEPDFSIRLQGITALAGTDIIL